MAGRPRTRRPRGPEPTAPPTRREVRRPRPGFVGPAGAGAPRSRPPGRWAPSTTRSRPAAPALRRPTRRLRARTAADRTTPAGCGRRTARPAEAQEASPKKKAREAKGSPGVRRLKGRPETPRNRAVPDPPYRKDRRPTTTGPPPRHRARLARRGTLGTRTRLRRRPCGQPPSVDNPRSHLSRRITRRPRRWKGSSTSRYEIQLAPSSTARYPAASPARCHHTASCAGTSHCFVR